MFRRITTLSLIALFSLTAIWITSLFWVRPKDVATYRSFLEEQKQLAATGKSIPSSAYQAREQVRKDIWYLDGTRRLHYRIESDASTLTLVPMNQKIDIIENLQKIRCWMQDKIYEAPGTQTAMQQIRYFEADKGSYQYTTQQFLAQTVTLSLFRTPGVDLPLHTNLSGAFLKGIAKDVSFSVSGKTPQFQAQQFKAIFNKSDL